MHATTNSRAARSSDLGQAFLPVLVMAVISAAALILVHQRGWTLYYGDAEAHLNIARRLLDSRTPGPDQLGTVWLPLPHLLMFPLAQVDSLWQNGLAGALPAAFCFVVAGAFLFAAVRRVFGSAAAVATTALFGLNPNLLYLQSTPMTEAMFFASLMALLYYSLKLNAVGAGLAALAGTLIRYEGWFLLPFTAIYFLLTAKHKRLQHAALFTVISALGPILWLAHNRWYFSDALAFYWGPYSPKAIQGSAPYPGYGDWGQAWLYFRTAVQLCAGWPLVWMGLAGAVTAAYRRVFWPVLLLALPGAFYLWSMHSSGGSPIFVPTLWPKSYYNTRYGLALFPLAVFAAGALVTLVPRRLRPAAAALIVIAGISPWLLRPHPDRWVTWKEAEVNSTARRNWTRQAAEFLKTEFHQRAGVFTSFGDITGIYRQATIPLRETLTGDNAPLWDAAVARPDLFLWEQWAVVMGGDSVQTAINRSRRRGRNYALVKTIIVKGAPVIEIYRRDENSLHQSARRQE